MKNDLEQKIDEVLSRGVGDFIDPDNSFRKKLLAKSQGNYKKDIVIKYGVDPTRPDIHLGHAVCFRKLRQLQELGCKIIFLVGEFTAMIGDPTGKNKTRPDISLDEVQRNMRTYLEQVGALLDVSDPEKFSWISNSDWYVGVTDMPGNTDVQEKARLWQESRMQNKLPQRILNDGRGQTDTVSLATFVLNGLKQITFAQLIERDMFQKRIQQNKELYMHEMLYPVFQGLDSYVLHQIYGSCDIEIGGTDQTFNMLMGRRLMEKSPASAIEPQAVLSVELLEGLDGKEKMSKSLDNYIAITDVPNEMFGKVMSLPDHLITRYFDLCTNVSLESIKQIEIRLDAGENPRDAKLRLAKEIVTMYHGADEAAKAEQYFIDTFSKKQIPENISEVSASDGEKLLDVIVRAGFAESKGDARRKIEQGGVEIDSERVNDFNAVIISDHNEKVLKVGKKDFVKIVF